MCNNMEWTSADVLLARTSANRMFVLPSFLAVCWENPSIDMHGSSYSTICLSSCKWLIMPLNVARSHWALLIADVTAGTDGIGDSMPTLAVALRVQYFIHCMAGRAAVTGEWQSGRLQRIPCRVSRMATAAVCWLCWLRKSSSSRAFLQ